MAATAASTNAVVANLVELSPAVGVGAAGVPVNWGDASSAPPTLVMSEAWKLTAPVRELKLVTPPGGMAEIAASTNAVVAIWVELLPACGVGASGVPTKIGEFNNAPPTPVMSEAWKLTLPVLPLKLETPVVDAATAASTKAVVAIWVVSVPGGAVGALGTPVKLGDAKSAPPTPVMSAVRKLTLPVRPLKLDTPVVDAATAASTNAVVANWVVLVPGAAVGPLGVPVNVGDANNAPPAPVMSEDWKTTVPVLPLKLATPAVEAATAFSTNAVVAKRVELSPACGVGAVGLPVNAGELMGAPPTPVTSPSVNVTTPCRPLKLETLGGTCAGVATPDMSTNEGWAAEKVPVPSTPVKKLWGTGGKVKTPPIAPDEGGLTVAVEVTGVVVMEVTWPAELTVMTGVLDPSP